MCAFNRNLAIWGLKKLTVNREMHNKVEIKKLLPRNFSTNCIVLSNCVCIKTLWSSVIAEAIWVTCRRQKVQDMTGEPADDYSQEDGRLHRGGKAWSFLLAWLHNPSFQDSVLTASVSCVPMCEVAVFSGNTLSVYSFVSVYITWCWPNQSHWCPQQEWPGSPFCVTGVGAAGHSPFIKFHRGLCGHGKHCSHQAWPCFVPFPCEQSAWLCCIFLGGCDASISGQMCLEFSLWWSIPNGNRKAD